MKILVTVNDITIVGFDVTSLHRITIAREMRAAYAPRRESTIEKMREKGGGGNMLLGVKISSAFRVALAPAVTFETLKTTHVRACVRAKNSREVKSERGSIEFRRRIRYQLVTGPREPLEDEIAELVQLIIGSLRSDKVEIRRYTAPTAALTMR